MVGNQMQQIPMNASIHPPYAIFSRQEFYATIGDDLGLGKEILAIVLNEIPTRIRNIQNFIKQCEIASLRSEIHDLKGMVGLLGCASLHQQIISLKTISQPITTDQVISLNTMLDQLKLLEKDLRLFSKTEHQS
jgi:hypothetical protein